MVQYETTEHDWVLLARVKTPRSEPAQPEIETYAESPINGKPGLSSDLSSQRKYEEWENNFEKWWETITSAHFTHSPTYMKKHSHKKAPLLKVQIYSGAFVLSEIPPLVCGLQVVTWPPSPWRLNEERFRRERLLIYRSPSSNGWLVPIQGRGMIHADTGPGRDLHPAPPPLLERP